MTPFLDLAVEVTIYQILLAGLDIEYGNIPPKHTGIFLEVVRWFAHLLNSEHLQNTILNVNIVRSVKTHVLHEMKHTN